MQTKIQQKNGVIILELTGKIIGEAIPELRGIMIRQIDASETPRFLINFEHVYKMDSAGLGLLVNMYAMTKQKKGRIAIINVGKHIKNLIVQSRLINIFEHFSTEDAAVKAFSNNY
ncbi:MAG: anti-sigma factor antagonist [Candidatus Poribacteria bacterium]|nr:anti-sigma factor antagonist [Candidatus Poribacteria bacterium]